MGLNTTHPLLVLAAARYGGPDVKSNLAEYLVTVSNPTAEYAETAERKYVSFNFSANSALSAVLG